MSDTQTAVLESVASTTPSIEKVVEQIEQASESKQLPSSSAPFIANRNGHGPLPAELLPNEEDLITEDDTPVDIYSGVQYNFLTGILYATPNVFGPNRPFIAVSNVGLYTSDTQEPLVPDVMVSLDVTLPDDLSEKGNRAYMSWRFGKLPEVVIEVVTSDTDGEDSTKMQRYECRRIAYYVIYDPQQYLSKDVIRTYEIRGMHYVQQPANWLPPLGLGLTLWTGKYQGFKENWLRWCDRDGNLLLTGYESADQASQQADEASRQADEARHRTEQAKQPAAQFRHEHKRIQAQTAMLVAQLRELGVDPNLPEPDQSNGETND